MEIKELISREKIERSIKEVAKQITEEYNGKTILMLCVLKGASVFATELAKNIETNVRFEFIEVSSYVGTESTGKIKINKDISSSVEGMDVLVVEDIIDTGRTLSYLKQYILDKNPKSLKICTLIDKPSRRVVDLKPEYNCFEIEDKFIIGYGMDYNEDYRNLPYIGVIEN